MTLIRLVENNPDDTITELRDKDITAQDYLYRNDKVWLYEHYAKKRKRNGGNNMVDWNKRDKELLINIKEVIANKEYENITLSFIGNSINNKSFLLTNIHKLPLTKAYIEKIKVKSR